MDGGWRFVHPWSVHAIETPSGTLERTRWDAPYDAREYTLFGLLGHSRPRVPKQMLGVSNGFPEDLSEVGRRIVAEWEPGGLSTPGWIRSDALLAHDWDTPSEETMCTQRSSCPIFVDGFLPSLETYGPPASTRVCFFFFP